jgi:hypothetical protein
MAIIPLRHGGDERVGGTGLSGTYAGQALEQQERARVRKAGQERVECLAKRLGKRSWRTMFAYDPLLKALRSLPGHFLATSATTSIAPRRCIVCGSRVNTVCRTCCVAMCTTARPGLFPPALAAKWRLESGDDLTHESCFTVFHLISHVEDLDHVSLQEVVSDGASSTLSPVAQSEGSSQSEDIQPFTPVAPSVSIEPASGSTSAPSSVATPASPPGSPTGARATMHGEDQAGPSPIRPASLQERRKSRRSSADDGSHTRSRNTKTTRSASDLFDCE